MDTSEPFGWWADEDGETSIIGAQRDPSRWCSWADIIFLVRINQ